MTKAPLSPQDRSKNLVAAILGGNLTDDASSLEKKISSEEDPPVTEPAPDPKKEEGTTPAPEPKKETTPTVEDDPFAAPEPPAAPVEGQQPEPTPPVESEAHKRAMQTLRGEIAKVAGEKTKLEGDLSAANNRVSTLEAELEKLRANPGAPVFQPLTKEDALKDPVVSKHLDELSSAVNNLLGDVGEATATVLQPDISTWMDKAGEINNDPAKRREFITSLETEFPGEDGRSMAGHLIRAAELARSVNDATAALIAEPAKNGMLRARKDWETKKQTMLEELTGRLKVEGTKIAENPYHPLTFIAASVAGDDKWKAESAKAMQDTLAIFTGVEPLSETDFQSFSGAFDDSAGKEITTRRENYNKLIKPAVIQMYAIKMLAPLLQPALAALAEKQAAAAKKESERTAVGGGGNPPAAPTSKPTEDKMNGPLDILKAAGLYPK